MYTTHIYMHNTYLYTPGAAAAQGAQLFAVYNCTMFNFTRGARGGARPPAPQLYSTLLYTRGAAAAQGAQLVLQPFRRAHPDPVRALEEDALP